MKVPYYFINLDVVYTQCTFQFFLVCACVCVCVCVRACVRVCVWQACNGGMIICAIV